MLYVDVLHVGASYCLDDILYLHRFAIEKLKRGPQNNGNKVEFIYIYVTCRTLFK